MQFGVLGSLYVKTGSSDTPQTISAPRLRTLLAVLLWRANHPVPVDELADLVWDGAPPAGAGEAVRALVMRLRRRLDGPAAARIVTRAPGYAIELSGDEWDAGRFEALTGRADQAVRTGRWAEAAQVAQAALGLWRGAPLSDVPSERLRGQWVPVLEQLHLRALACHIEADLHEGRHEQLIPQLRELTARHPLWESVHGQLMVALARSGRRGEALAVYHEVRSVLADELGIDPGPELRRLQEAVRAGETEATAAPAIPEASVRPAPGLRQLPASVRSFVGRQSEVDRLDALVRQALDPGGTAGTVVISAIDGMAGVGKTALAVHAAHRLAGEFPDGQLFIDMHGYTQGHEPRPASEGLEVFLRALDVQPQRIPPGPEERAAMFRHRLAGTRTLIVLDNVADEAQVQPLLPGSPGCVVLVTSRRRLRALDEAYLLSLDVLPPADALELFRTVAGADRVPRGDAAAAEIVELCGRLPLAVRIAAALLRHRPAWTLDHLAALLRAEQTRIGTLSDRRRDLSTIFGLSYRSLTDAEQLTFRYLGLIPGPDFDRFAVAALTGTDVSDASARLENLVDHNMVLPGVPGRYRLHDLIRLHTRDLANRDPAPVRDAALDRLMDYYEHTAARADALISRFPRLGPAGPAPADAPELPERDAGRAWLRTERANLLAALHHATAHDRPGRAVALAADLATLLRNDGPWTEAIALHTGAIAAARSLGDRPGESSALVQLGVIRTLTGDYPGALEAVETAGRSYQQLGDRLGQANALTQLGEIRGVIDDVPGAVKDLEQALLLYEQLDEPLGRANALARRGNIRRYTGDLPGALPDLERALRLYRQVDNPDGQSTMLIALGNVQRLTGDFADAAGHLDEALRVSDRLDLPIYRANALAELGELRRVIGDHAEAARCLEQALQIYRDRGNQMGQANAQVWLGSVRLATGDLPGAIRLLEAAMDLFRRIGSRGSAAWALNRYAAVLSAAGHPARAEAQYLEALRLARETSRLDDEAHALEGVAECRLRRGETGPAVTQLKEALDMFQRMALRPDADRLRTRLAGLPRDA